MTQKNNHDPRPIGVFDSGIGGLTVLKALLKELPQESYIYIGDTKNLPYGTKSPETIKELSLAIASELLTQNVKALVIACNTISSVAFDEIKNRAKHIPVINVIDPTVSYVAEHVPEGDIAVIGTQTTIESGVYQKKLGEQEKHKVFAKATPSFVPLIEENPHDHPLIKEAIELYLSEFKKKRIRALILGCTHYPLIKAKISTYLGHHVAVIDSAKPTAGAVRELLIKQNMLHGKNQPTRIFFTSDDPSHAITIAKEFLGGNLVLQKLLLRERS